MTIKNIIQKLKNSPFIQGGMHFLDLYKETFTSAAAGSGAAFPAVAVAVAAFPAVFAVVAVAAGASAAAGAVAAAVVAVAVAVVAGVAGASVAAGIAFTTTATGAGVAGKKGKKFLAGFLTAATLGMSVPGYGGYKGLEYTIRKIEEQQKITDIYNKSAACTKENISIDGNIVTVPKLCDVKTAP